MLESGDDVTPQSDKIMPLVPATVPEINIEPNHGSRSEQLRRALSWDEFSRMATKQHPSNWRGFE